MPFIFCSDESESGSDDSATDDDEEDQQQIPEWARGAALREALAKQYGLDGSTPMDPDVIFPEVVLHELEIFALISPGHHLLTGGDLRDN